MRLQRQVVAPPPPPPLLLLLLLPLLLGTPPPLRADGAAYGVPTPRIDALSPRGLRVAIPDDAGISLVRFHLGVNRPLSAQRLGAVNVEVSRPTGTTWAYEDRSTVLGDRDVLHYWLQVTRAGRTYERAGTYTVQDFVETYDIGGSGAAEGSPEATAPLPQDEEQACGHSVTSVNGRLACRGDLVFLENFDGADLRAGPWSHDVRIAGKPDYEFTAFTESPANTYTVNSQLVIRPTLTDDVYGKDFVRTGRLHLENCTAGPAEPEQCTRQARYGYILPPLLSGRVTTRRAFSFRYGTIEVRAKLPSGDWIYPELWLLPREAAYGPGLASGRVHLALARGNAELHLGLGSPELGLGATELGLRRLEAGAVASAADSEPAHRDHEYDLDVEPYSGDAGAREPPRPPPVLPPTTRTYSAGSTPASRTPGGSSRDTTATTPAARRPAPTSTAPPAAATRPPSRSGVGAGAAATTATPAAPGRAAATGNPGTLATGSTRTAAKGGAALPASGKNSGGSSSPASAKPGAGGPQTVVSGGGPARGSGSTGSPTSGSGIRTRPYTPSPLVLPDTTNSPLPHWAAAAGGGDVREDSWFRGRRIRAAPSGPLATPAPPGWGPARKEVSRTELPGRPWSGGFHNYTLRWTPDRMVFSVDGVELGTLLPESAGGLLRTADPDAAPWRRGGIMAPFDREFYISLGLSVGGIRNFPDGVEGPNGAKKPWKNTAAKAMLSFWNAKDEWYQSWSLDSALLVDFVRVTAL